MDRSHVTPSSAQGHFASNVSLVPDTRGYLSSLGRSSEPPRRHFVHVPQNGGLSVRAALGGSVGMTPSHHWRYIDLYCRKLADVGYFAVVRNPWSRVVSRYLHGMSSAAQWGDDDPKRRYFGPGLTFDRFVRDQRWFSVPDWPGRPWMGPHGNWYDQLEWIRDKEGELACDCLRFEHLGEDLAAFLGHRVDLPAPNVTARGDYRRMYCDETAEIVARIHREDIEVFGFSFDSAATRQIAVL